MFKKTKVIIQLVSINYLFLSGVFCDVNELKLPSTTANYDVTTTSNIQTLNIDPVKPNTDYSANPVNSRILLYDTPENYNKLPQGGQSPRLSVSNTIIPSNYKNLPNSNQYYTNGCGLNQNNRCNTGILGNTVFRNSYNTPSVQDRLSYDATGSDLGYNNQYQPNNLGTAIYTRPSYTGNLGQTIYNKPSVIEKPIYQYNGNLGQNVISQPSRCCAGRNIDQKVITRPSGCCYNGNVGQNVANQASYYLPAVNQPNYPPVVSQPNYPLVNQPSYYPPVINQPNYPPFINQPGYYPPNNDYIYNKPCRPCVEDDTVEITNGYYYPKPSYPVQPTYLPPIYSTPQTIFPPATAKIGV